MPPDPTDAPAPLPFEAMVDIAGQPRTGPVPVARALEPEEGAALARFLGIPAVESLAFEGRLAPWGEAGWALTGRLAGTVVQTCVVTLEPVTETVAAEIERRYLPGAERVEAETLEIGPEDLDAPEPLAGGRIDLAAVMVEALALALEPYPRRGDAEFEGRVHAAPGVEPLTDETAHPFAGLAGLRARMGGDGGE
jgi:uncharacterized metal-binding protein YceD (DUF177 family)